MGRTSKGLALIIILIVAVSSLLIVQPAKAQVENVSTSCSISIQPHNPVEGQPITVLLQIQPAPPAGEIFSNLIVMVISPYAGGVVQNGQWHQDGIFTDSNGTANVTFNLPTSIGYWNAEVIFKGQYFANNTVYYQSGDWQICFPISSPQTPTTITTESPIPTPIIPEFSILAVIPLILFTLSFVALFRRRKITNLEQ